MNPAAVLDLDVSNDAQIDAAVKEVGKVWDSVDVLVHSIGYAPREALDGRFTDVTTREALAHHHGRLGLLAHRAGPRLPAA